MLGAVVDRGARSVFFAVAALDAMAARGCGGNRRVDGGDRVSRALAAALVRGTAGAGIAVDLHRRLLADAGTISSSARVPPRLHADEIGIDGRAHERSPACP